MMAQHTTANVRPFPVRSTLNLDRIGREIHRVVIGIEVAKANRRDDKTTAPTIERLRHGAVEQYGATDSAGEIGHRVVDACLLDALWERGALDDPVFEGAAQATKDAAKEAGFRRYCAGLWLRGLFHDSGLMRGVTMMLNSAGGGSGNPERPAAYEASTAASEALRQYQAVMLSMEKPVLVGDGRTVRAGTRRRYCHAVREIACWDRWPQAYNAREVREAFDRLAAMEGVEVRE